MARILHGLIVAYFLGVFLQGCGFQANPYYGQPSNTRDFKDLMLLESKIE